MHSSVHAGEGFSIRAKADSACQRFKKTLSHSPSMRDFKQAHEVINSKYLQSAFTAMQT